MTRVFDANAGRHFELAGEFTEGNDTLFIVGRMLAVDRDRNFRLKEAEEIDNLLIQLGVTPDKEVIMHCQTHHRSSHTYLVLKSLGYKNIKGYDGSWSEWGNDPDVPIES